MPKYPNISVQLVGTDGNAFALIGKVQSALQKGGVPAADVSAFVGDAMASQSYDALLGFLMSTVDVL